MFVFTGLFIRLYAWDLSNFRRNSVRLFRKICNGDDSDPMRVRSDTEALDVFRRFIAEVKTELERKVKTL